MQTPTLRDLADYLFSRSATALNERDKHMLALSASIIVEMEGMYAKLEKLNEAMTEISRLERELANRV